MVPPLQFAGWEWVALALSTPVVFYAGLGFHRAALRSARHGGGDDGHADLARHARRLDVVDGRARRRARRATPTSRSPPSITTLILLGRYLEARAKGRSSEAIRRLLELGAKEARVLRDGEEVLVPVAELQVGDRLRRPARARRSRPTASSSRASRRSTSRC